MPSYEFLCQKCKKPFERVYSLEEYKREESKKTIECPTCGSKNVVRQISVFEVKTAKKS